MAFRSSSPRGKKKIKNSRGYHFVYSTLLSRLFVFVHSNLEYLLRQLRNLTAQSRQCGFDALDRLRLQLPFPRVHVHARRREQRLREESNHIRVARPLLVPVPQNLPLGARNHEPPLSAPVVRQTCTLTGICRRLVGVGDGEGLVDATHGFERGGGERLVGDQVVNLRGRSVGDGRVGDDDVAVLAPERERRVGHIPRAGEP